MYCFPRLKDLPTPNFVFRLENETANCEGRKKGGVSCLVSEGGGNKTNILMWYDNPRGASLFKSFSPSVAHATTVKIERLPSVRRAPSPTRYHFYSRFWRAFRPISFARGGIRLRSGRDKLQGCTGTLFEIFLHAPLRSYDAQLGLRSDPVLGD